MALAKGQQYNIGEKSIVILYTYYALIAMQIHQNTGKQITDWQGKAQSLVFIIIRWIWLLQTEKKDMWYYICSTVLQIIRSMVIHYRRHTNTVVDPMLLESENPTKCHEEFCPYSLWSNLNVLVNVPPDGVDAQKV